MPTVQNVAISLYRQIHALCNRPAPYRIRPVWVDNPPESLAELLRYTAATPERDSTGALLGQTIYVSGEHCDRTIWPSREANMLLRAWHDSHHILLGAEFDLTGELRCARYACTQVEGSWERRVLWADLAGQSLYYDRHGSFPENQADFVVDFVQDPEYALARGGY